VLWLSGCGTSVTDPAYHSIPRHTAAADAGPDATADSTDVGATKPEATAANPGDAENGAPAETTDSVASNDPPADKPATAEATVEPGASNDAPPPEYKALVKEKKLQKEGDGALRLTYDDLDLEKILNMKKAVASAPKLMPEWMHDLDGKKVRLRGFMLPTFEQDGIGRFILCRDTGACCFGPNPTIYYLVEVTMKPGTTTGYIDNRPFDVEGTFKIDLQSIPETGEVYKLYELRDAAIIKR